MINHHIVMMAHGILMILAWALLIPCGVACGKFLRQPDSLIFFRIHYLVAAVGVLLAIVAWILPLTTTSTTSASSSNAHYYHKLLGKAIMWIALVNVLLYPAMGKPSTTRSGRQIVAVLTHLSLGYMLILAAFGNCVLGIHGKKTSSWWYGGLAVAWAISLTVGGKLWAKTRQPANGVGETQRLLPQADQA